MKTRFLLALVGLLLAAVPGLGWPESTSSAMVIWSDAAVQEEAFEEAPPLPVYEVMEDGRDVVVRVAVHKAPGMQRLGVRGQYLTDRYKWQSITLRNADTGARASWTPVVEGAWADFGEAELYLDISELSDGTTYEFEVLLETEYSIHGLKARRLAIVIVGQ